MTETAKEAQEAISVIGAEAETEKEEPASNKSEQQTLCSSWHDTSYRRKFIYTVYLTIAFAMLGFIIGQRGPSFLDLQIITDTDVERGSAFFTAGSVGYLLGSLIGGVIYDKFNKILIMCGMCLGAGISTGIIPFCSPYGLMIFIQIVSGLFSGGIDTCGNAELVRVWGSEGRSAMQTAHFAFALGGVISPLYTKPFLAPMPENLTSVENTMLNFTGGPTYNLTLNFGNSSNATSSGEGEKPTTIVFYAFLITAFFTVLSSIPFFVTFFQERSHMKKRLPGETTEAARELPFPVYLITLIFICITYFLYCSVEDTFAAYLMTFMVKGQGWTKVRGTELTSAFWASFAIGRLLGILFVKWISTVKLLFLCCVSLIISLTGFLVSAQYFSVTGSWICAIGAGVSMSVFFPAGLSWIEDELMKLSGKVSSAVLISSSSGTMVNPIMIGYLMETYSPNWYTYILTAESAACLTMFLILLIFSRTYLKKVRQKSTYEIDITVNGNVPNSDQKLM